jgi:RNase adaptor protein for sRNA GlmZ degradation
METRTVEIMSFGFLNGPPENTLLNVNLTKMKTPPNVSNRSGEDSDLRAEIFQMEENEKKYQNVKQKILDRLNNELLEGINICIGLGCHHGKHRSVKTISLLMLVS